MNGVRVVPIADTDRDWVRAVVAEHWSGDLMVTPRRHTHPVENPSFLAIVEDEAPTGLLTYELLDDECEATSLGSLRPGLGIGTQLLNAAIVAACIRTDAAASSLSRPMTIWMLLPSTRNADCASARFIPTLWKRHAASSPLSPKSATTASLSAMNSH